MSGYVSATERLEMQIAEQRQALAETADALGAKLDVKARAAEKAAEVKQEVKHQVTHVATTGSGRPRPTLLGGAVLAAAAVGALVWWRRRS